MSRPPNQRLASSVQELDAVELYFLVADFLSRSTPCQRAASVMREELMEHGLLGVSYNWQGQSHRSTPQELGLKYRRLPRDQLPRLLQAALQSNCGEDGGERDIARSQHQQASSARKGNVVGASQTSIYVTSLLAALPGAENSPEAIEVRHQLARTLHMLNESSGQLRRVIMAISRAEQAAMTKATIQMIIGKDPEAGRDAGGPAPSVKDEGQWQHEEGNRLCPPAGTSPSAPSPGAVRPQNGPKLESGAGCQSGDGLLGRPTPSVPAATVAGDGREAGPEGAGPATVVPEGDGGVRGEFTDAATTEGMDHRGHGDVPSEMRGARERDTAGTPASVPDPSMGPQAPPVVDVDGVIAASATEEAGVAEAGASEVRVEKQGWNEMGLASRARARRELEECVARLEAEVGKLLVRARELQALRTRRTHEACRTHADMVLRRQTLPCARRQLPRRALPPPSLYASRLLHQKTVNGHMFCPVYCLKYDKHGQYVVTGADDQLVKLWSARSGSLMRSLRGHSGVITDLCVSSDNALLATSSEDGVVRIWNAADGTPLSLLRGHTDTINYVHFHPFYNLLLTGSDDGSARVWDLGALKYSFQEKASPLPPVASDALPSPVVLDHTSAGGGTEERARVKCLSVCPLGGFLATGAEDGVGRIWSLEGPERKGGRAEEEARLLSSASSTSGWTGSSRPGGRRTAATTNGLPSALQPPHDRLGPPASQEEGTSTLVCRLQAHKSAVTDINYSNLGDRLFTGSMPEGVVRVWSWGPGYTQLSNVLLDPHAVAEEDAGYEVGGEGEARQEEGGWNAGLGGASTVGGGSGGHASERRAPKNGGGSASRKESIPTVDNALWTCDDQRIVTAHSTKPAAGDSPDQGDWQQHFKLWDPATGKLLRVLQGHRRQSTVLAVHPSDARIIMSAGYDGKVCLWDVEAGRCLQAFTNVLLWGPPGNDYNLGDPVALVDGQFSADGWSFSVADACGRLLLFGPEEKSRYARVASEQYFVGDYDQLQWDVHGNVIDAARQMAPHLLGRRALTNAERVAYPDQPAHDLTGPFPLTRAEMARKIVEAREKACGVEKLVEGRAAAAAEAAAKALAKLPSRTCWGPGERRSGAGGRGVGIHRGRREGWVFGAASSSNLYGHDFQYAWNSEEEEEEEEEVGRGGRGDGMSRAERLRRRRLGLREAYHGGGDSVGRSARQRERRRLGRGEGGRRGSGYGHGEEDGADEESWSEGEDDANDPDYHAHGRRRAGFRGRRRRRMEAVPEQLGAGGGGDREGRNASGPIDPRAQGLPVELDDFDESITATTLLPSLGPLTGEVMPAPAGTAAVDAPGDMEAGEGRDEEGEGDAGDHGQSVAVGVLPAPPPVVSTLEGARPNADGEVDRRTLLCALCGKGHSEAQPLPGPVLGSHPLKIRDRPVWVHDDCAHWSPQTFVGQEDGRWYNILVEVRRGRKTKCKGCNKLGATIGCYVRTCSRSYHYPCAVATGWTFSPEVYFHCEKHRARNAGEEGRAGGRAPRGRSRRKRRGGGENGEDGEGEGEEEEEEEEEASYVGMETSKAGAVYKGQWYPGHGMETAREWLRCTKQEQDWTGLLVPQTGDQVVYLPRAHYEAQVLFAARRMEGGKSSGGVAGGGKKASGAKVESKASTPRIAAGAAAGLPATFTGPWDVLPLEWAAVQCRVDRISYLFPESERAYRASPSVVCRVSLTVLAAGEFIPDAVDSEDEAAAAADGMKKQAYGWWNFDGVSSIWEGFTLEVDVRHEPDAPTYFVLDACFNNAMLHGWEPGARLKAPYLEMTRTGRNKLAFRYGTLEALGQPMLEEEEAVQASGLEEGPVQSPGPWQWLEVRWDGGGGGGGGGGDEGLLERVNAWQVLPAEAAENFPFWGAPSLRAEEQEVALAGLTALASEDQYYSFVPPVPWGELPSYPLLIPLPMEYDLILARLRGGYYRSLPALETDLKLVTANCQVFNRPGAEIIDCAKTMQAAAMGVVREAKGAGAAAAKREKESNAEEGGEEEGRKGMGEGGVHVNGTAATGGGGGEERGGRGWGEGYRRSTRDRKRRIHDDEDGGQVEEAGGFGGQAREGDAGLLGGPRGPGTSGGEGQSKRPRRESRRGRRYGDEEEEEEEEEGDEEEEEEEDEKEKYPIGHPPARTYPRSERLATSQAMAASLRETRAGATASPDLRRSSRRGLAPSSSSAATSLFGSEQRGQPLRYVVSSHGPGDEHTLRVRLRPVTEDMAADREKGSGTGGGDDRPEGGRNRGGLMLRRVRSRLRDDGEGNRPASLAPAAGRGGTGREGYVEPPLERLQAVIGRLLDEVAAADDYQILPSISVGRDGENMNGGGPRRSGRTGGSGNGAVTWTGILARNERPGGYDSVEEVETEVRLLLQGLVRSHETIYVAEGRRILNDLPRMMRDALDEA